MHSIKELSNVTGYKRELGFKRLGVVIRDSMKLQELSTRDFAKITKNLFGVPINKDNIVKLTKGHTGNPSLDTYRRLTPMLFRVKYFECSELNPVGRPIFIFTGNYADDSTKR